MGILKSYQNKTKQKPGPNTYQTEQTKGRLEPPNLDIT